MAAPVSLTRQSWHGVTYMHTKMDFSRLEANAAAWLKRHLEDVRDTFGEGQAYAVAVELEDDPWTVLQLYVEDVRDAARAA
ncbi:hypothetical protein X749_25285 [Mesorhizobium sp. LNJC391B00]|nr:hypothetical protein X749_25285 [Mesorhizobium sp. LNJC391B00]